MTELFDPTAPLEPSGNLRRRAVISRLASLTATGSAIIAVGVLGLVVYGVIARGAAAITLPFLTHDPPAVGGAGGGIASAVVGTVLIVALATAMALPIGVLCALFLTELGGARYRLGRVLKSMLDVMQSLPTIVVGIFVFGLIVAPAQTDSGFAGSVALAIIMLPLIARASMEVLLMVPDPLREGAEALGVNRWRTIRGVILPAAIGGIATGTILAVARAAGETAPLLLVDGVFQPSTTIHVFGQGVPNIPVMIWTLSESADPSGFTRAWGAALVLLTGILVANVGARILLSRSRRRLTR